MANEAARFHPRSESGAFAPATDRRQLTERQAAFAKAYAENGGKGMSAALSAGYSESSCRTIAQQLLALPWVLRAITIERKRITERAGLAALQVIISILDDAKEDKRLRLKAAEIGLKAVARDDAGEKDPAGTGKALSAMSVAELEALVRRLDQAAELARLPILEHNEQQTLPINTQPIDTTE